MSRVKRDLVETPLIFVDNIVVSDKKSWQWMVNQLGLLKMPKRLKYEPASCYNYAPTELCEHRLHEPTRNPDRHYGGDKYDRMKYMGTGCGLYMYVPLNFHDEPMWRWNS